MKRAVIAAVMILMAVAHAASAGELPAVMVLNIKHEEQAGPGIAKILTDLVLQNLHDIGRFRVIGEKDIDQMLSQEQRKQLAGCSDTSCIVEIAGAMGTTYTIDGTVGVLGKSTVLSLSLLDVTKAAVVSRKTTVVKGEREQLLDAVHKIIRDLVTPVLNEKLPPQRAVKSTGQANNCVQPLAPVKGGPMCVVPAGEFLRGCNAEFDKECMSDEKPGHKVYLDAFKIDRHEVTVAAYKECVYAGACKEPKKGGACNWGSVRSEDHPVNCVHWSQASAFCEWVGKRLPTEAEWEKSARGTDGRKYPWGNDLLDCDRAVHSANGCTASGTSPVASKPSGASPYGVLDMVGNVLEWVNDWHSEKYYAESPIKNPQGPSSAVQRVLKGGSWSNGATYYLRASMRDRDEPNVVDDETGFRCAK